MYKRETKRERETTKFPIVNYTSLTLYSNLHARTHKDIIKFYGSIYSVYYIIFSKSFFLLNYYLFIQYFCGLSNLFYSSFILSIFLLIALKINILSPILFSNLFRNSRSFFSLPILSRSLIFRKLVFF